MKILLIIPAYNEENCITKVIDELVERYPQYDYIIVNDGSTDHTSEICHKSGYEIIDLPINLGLAGAFQTGLKYAYLKIMIMLCRWMQMDSICLNILKR